MTYLRTSFGNIFQDMAGAESASANKLFAVYSEWCEQYCGYRMSSTKFGMEMSKRFPKLRTSAGQIYRGIALSDVPQSRFTVNY
nr:MAG TPA: RFX DNA-binding domain protein [Caudoviricetes sp.]